MSDYKELLRAAIAARDEAIKLINSILAAHPHKNKTTAKYIILQLCAQCGKEKALDAYYCEPCRKKFSAMTAAKYAAKMQPKNPQFEQYNNDNH